MAFSRGCTPGENWCENYILIAFPAQGRIHNRAAPKCVFYALNVKKEITQLQATTRGTFRGVRNDDKVGFYHLNNIQHSWDLCRRSDQSVLLRGGRPLEVFLEIPSWEDTLAGFWFSTQRRNIQGGDKKHLQRKKIEVPWILGPTSSVINGSDHRPNKKPFQWYCNLAVS